MVRQWFDECRAAAAHDGVLALTFGTLLSSQGADAHLGETLFGFPPRGNRSNLRGLVGSSQIAWTGDLG